MNILVIGGTKFVGVHLVRQLLAAGHRVTLANRGTTADTFGDTVDRIILERTDADAIRHALGGRHFDAVYDSQAFSSNEVKYLLDAVSCGRYIATSTVSVYSPNFKLGLTETDFDPLRYPLKWCTRTDFAYDEIKRQVECAMFQTYRHIPAVAVRFPLIIGEDDYTQRLHFYVRHIMDAAPMHVDNLQAELAFIFSWEAGRFLAWLADKGCCGSINAANVGTATLGDIIAYIEEKSARKAVLSDTGEPAPLNGFPDYSLDLSKAEALGFHFEETRTHLHRLLGTF